MYNYTHMALGKKETIINVKVDNKTNTVVSRSVEQVVVNNQLVPDHRDIDPGVIDKGFKR